MKLDKGMAIKVAGVVFTLAGTLLSTLSTDHENAKKIEEEVAKKLLNKES